MDRLSIDRETARIRRSVKMRMDEEPESWITLKNGQHVPLNSEGEAIGGAGGWAKGKSFSKAKSTSETNSAKSPKASVSKKAGTKFQKWGTSLPKNGEIFEFGGKKYAVTWERTENIWFKKFDFHEIGPGGKVKRFAGKCISNSADAAVNECLNKKTSGTAPARSTKKSTSAGKSKKAAKDKEPEKTAKEQRQEIAGKAKDELEGLKPSEYGSYGWKDDGDGVLRKDITDKGTVIGCVRAKIKDGKVAHTDVLMHGVHEKKDYAVPKTSSASKKTTKKKAPEKTAKEQKRDIAGMAKDEVEGLDPSQYDDFSWERIDSNTLKKDILQDGKAIGSVRATVKDGKVTKAEVSINGTPEWFKYEDSKGESIKSGTSKGKGSEKPVEKYRTIKIGGTEYKELLVDNESGNNPKSAKKLETLDKKLDDSKLGHDAAYYIREAIKEETARAFPKDGNPYSEDSVRLKSADEKVAFIKRILDKEIKECEIGLKEFEYDDPWQYKEEKDELREKIDHHKKMKKILNAFVF